MEPNKVTVFLFLLLVVILAFSGFMIYDGLGGMPVFANNRDGVQMAVGYTDNIGTLSKVPTTVHYTSLYEGGAR